MCRHQIGGPVRNREIELAAMQDRPRLHRGLARATGVFKGIHLIAERPATVVAWALEAFGPDVGGDMAT